MKRGLQLNRLVKAKRDIWWSKQSLKKYLFYLLVFLIPTQLALHFWPSFSFIYGIRVDYLAPTIYLTDVLVLTVILLDAKDAYRAILKRKLFVGLFILLALFNIGFSTVPILSFIKWLHILVLFLFAIYASGVEKKNIEKVIYYSLVLFSIIGISQFILGRTIGGPLYYLGERSFTAQTPGIALFSLWGREVLRTYSTFSHPNSFAGYLGLGIIFLLLSKNFKKTLPRLFGLLIILAAFVLSFSLAALTSLIIIAGLYFFEKHFRNLKSFYIWILVVAIVVSLAQVLASNNNSFYEIFPQDKYSERLQLSNISGKMISERFFTGVGLNAFISNLPNFKAPTGYIWYLQPVHNIYLLIFSETGIAGIILFFIFIGYGFKKLFLRSNDQIVFSIMFILFTGLFDHYWLTLQQNSFFMFFLFSYFI